RPSLILTSYQRTPGREPCLRIAPLQPNTLPLRTKALSILRPPPPARNFGPGFGWKASICGVELSGVRYFLPSSIVCTSEMLAFESDQVILQKYNLPHVPSANSFANKTAGASAGLSGSGSVAGIALNCRFSNDLAWVRTGP